MAAARSKPDNTFEFHRVDYLLMFFVSPISACICYIIPEQSLNSSSLMSLAKIKVSRYLDEMERVLAS